mgnify:CR=1 FL=1
MTLMQLLACAGMITGAFLILGLKPMEFTDGLFGFLMQKPRTLKEEINEATSRKKPRVFRREIRTAQEILAMTGRESHFSMICAASLSLFCVGGSLANLMASKGYKVGIMELFSGPGFGGGLPVLPFLVCAPDGRPLQEERGGGAGDSPVHHYHSVFEE